MLFRPVSLPATVAIAAALFTPNLALSQDVINATAPTIPDIAWEDEGAPRDRAIPGTPFPYVRGRLAIRPHLTYSYVRSDGVRVAPGTSVSTNRQQIAPGVLFELGDQWSADYTASFSYYSGDDFTDSVDHALRLAGAVTYDLWRISLAHGSSRTNTVLIETARQTKQEIHGTSLRISRQLNSRLFADLGISQSLRYAENSPNAYDWSISPGATYRVGPNVSTFGSFNVGHTVVTESPDMIYFRPQVGLNWRVSQKLSASAFAGYERREFTVDGLPSRSAPTYGATVVHHLFPTTSLALSLSRQTGASYFSGQITESTRWSFDIGQRFFGRLQLSAGYSWGDTEFRATSTDLSVVRDDGERSYYVRLGTEFLRRGTIGVSYRRTKNDSSTRAFEFDSETFSIDVDYRY